MKADTLKIRQAETMNNLSDRLAISRHIAGPARAHKWVPLIWLPYFLFFLLQPVFEHAPVIRWVETGVGTVFFLVLYFGMFWSGRPWQWPCLAGLVLLGLVFAPINGGASSFFIYATAFAPFLANTEAKALKIIALIVGLVCLETWLLHLPWWFFVYSGGFAAVIGVGNIFFAQRNRANEKLRMAHEEIEHLAKVAERERIARDMHDVLGHTLSVIILKSELVGKLIDLDPERAKNEIRDVEQTSRQALTDVRNTIRGYRAQSLGAEFKQAKATLETAGVSVKAETGEVNLTPAQESVCALIVREAVTNVVRHAEAHTCSLRLLPMNGNCMIEIQDDGCGGNTIEGNGLRGMRERIEALGGTLQRETKNGTTLTIQFPLSPAKAATI
jgi:two-component system sensor histidine kinase DesK